MYIFSKECIYIAVKEYVQFLLSKVLLHCEQWGTLEYKISNFSASSYVCTKDLIIKYEKYAVHFDIGPPLLMIPSTEFYVHSNFCKVTFIVFQFPDAFFDSATLVEERERDATRKIVLIIKVVPHPHELVVSARKVFANAISIQILLSMFSSILTKKVFLLL